MQELSLFHSFILSFLTFIICPGTNLIHGKIKNLLLEYLLISSVRVRVLVRVKVRVRVRARVRVMVRAMLVLGLGIGLGLENLEINFLK